MNDIDHRSRDHAPFAPSGAERWFMCPLSVDENNPAPERSTAPANRGTAIHERAELHLDAWSDPAEDDTILTYIDPDKAELVALPPEEWQPHVIDYVAWVREMIDEAELLGDCVIEKEQRVTIYKDLCWGSADHYIAIVGVELHITDLKAGLGHMVSANSLQLKLYAIGVCERFKWQFKRVYLHVAQEANVATGGRDTHEVDIDELRDVHKQAIKKIQESRRRHKKGEQPTAKNIGDWCTMCPRLPTCPAHQAVAMEAAGLDPEQAPPKTLIVADEAELTEQRFNFILEFGDAIVGLVKQVHAEAKARLMEGQEVPNHKLVRSKTKRRWKGSISDDERVERLLQIAQERGKEVSRDDLVTVTTSVLAFSKVEKLLGKGTIDALLEKPEGHPTIAPMNDPRPAIDDQVSVKQFEDESDLPPEQSSTADLFEDESDFL